MIAEMPTAASATASRRDAVRLACERLRPIRARPSTKLEFAVRDATTRLTFVAQSGGYRVLEPRRTSTEPCEAVFVNTAGGMAGGDCASISVNVGAGASCILTTSAAERIYASAHDATTVAMSVACAAGSKTMILPQETILHAGSRLVRTIEADVNGTARLFNSEITAFGRPAMGEGAGDGSLSQTWRIRRDGRLVFAEAQRLAGELDRLLAKPFVAGGHRVVGTILYVAPEAESLVESCRRVLPRSDQLRIGISGWNGLAVIRLLARRIDVAREALMLAAMHLTQTPAPRVWGP